MNKKYTVHLTLQQIEMARYALGNFLQGACTFKETMLFFGGYSAALSAHSAHKELGKVLDKARGVADE